MIVVGWVITVTITQKIIWQRVVIINPFRTFKHIYSVAIIDKDPKTHKGPIIPHKQF